jgi:hypothetical protein
MTHLCCNNDNGGDNNNNARKSNPDADMEKPKRQKLSNTHDKGLEQF